MLGFGGAAKHCLPNEQNACRLWGDSRMATRKASDFGSSSVRQAPDVTVGGLAHYAAQQDPSDALRHKTAAC